jgi:transposase
MRRQRNGLAALVRGVLNEDPFRSDALFCFISKGRDKLKILYWNRTWLRRGGTKSSRREKFHWPRRTQEAVVTLPVSN